MESITLCSEKDNYNYYVGVWSINTMGVWSINTHCLFCRSIIGALLQRMSNNVFLLQEAHIAALCYYDRDKYNYNNNY